MTDTIINPQEIKDLRSKLDEYLYLTPLVRCYGLENFFSENTEIYSKFEFLQNTGTFKLRGALTSILNTDKNKLSNGVTAVSAGNHAIAVAYASKVLGVNAKVVMNKSSNIFRINFCKNLGAEVILAEHAHHAFDLVNEIEEKEKRVFIHPFEGMDVIRGTATLGYEICSQHEDFDVIIIPVGGGGLCAGVSSYVKAVNPKCDIYGIEPTGANTMQMSIKSNSPQSLSKITTVADSLAAPFSMPLSFQYCRDHLSELLLVNECEIVASMSLLFNEMKLAVEPACAVSTAALFGPLRKKIDGKRIVLVMCGSNIDWLSYKAIIGSR
ncbi:MAG: threonine/serine dehydratase [Pseudomonadota bacterium]|nr:threonine/serine dehydratase [Pseudomonadota bacterium]